MQGYPDGYVEALSRSHAANLITWISDPYGARVYDFPPITGGTITIDRTASIMRTLKMTVPDYTARDLGYAEAVDSEWFTPAGADGILAPYGNEIIISRGVSIDGYTDPFWGGNQRYFFLGVFRLSNAAVSTDDPGAVVVTAYDRSRTVARNLFSVPWVIAAGSNAVDAIVALVQDRLLPVVTSLTVTPSDETTPLLVLDPGMNPWDEAQKLATGIGYALYFGPAGDLVLRPDAVTSDDGTEDRQPLWTYDDQAASQLLRVDKDTSDEPGYNGVVLTAEATTLATPLRAEVWDDNPDSPTYAEGPYGRVPKFETSAYVANQSQADAACTAILRREMGGTEGINFDAIVNPALEAGDPVLVQSATQRIDHVAVVDRIELPLHVADPMRVTTRRYRSLS